MEVGIQAMLIATAIALTCLISLILVYIYVEKQMRKIKWKSLSNKL